MLNHALTEPDHNNEQRLRMYKARSSVFHKDMPWESDEGNAGAFWP